VDGGNPLLRVPDKSGREKLQEAGFCPAPVELAKLAACSAPTHVTFRVGTCRSSQGH